MRRSEAPETRQRILEAAGEIFAEQGFRNTTVRDICHLAGANIAAVNYHFGDKQALYLEVLRYAHHCSEEQYPPNLGLLPDPTPPERLHAFVRSFLLRIFDTGRPAWHGKLVSREMIEPTGALDMIVDEDIRPRAQALHAIVRSIIGRKAKQEEVWHCALSVVSQCLFYHHARPVIVRLNPRLKFNAAYIERLAEHITRFCLGAMRHWNATETKGGGR